MHKQAASLMCLVGLLLSCASARHSENEVHAALDEVHGPRHHDHELGEIDFPVSCNDSAQRLIEQGVGHLHHMMYDQSLPLFAAAAQADPSCAMAHWGIAMSSFQPLWHPTSETDLKAGAAAVQRARTLGAPTERERAYITAAAAFFADPKPPQVDAPADHRARVEAWKQAQRQVHDAYPEDVDAAAFYALAIIASAPTFVEDPTYPEQRRAGAILEGYFERHPEHPGLFHYLIHAYDNPALAHRAEPVARAYDDIAPDVPHALHMPSHIFVRLGQWKEAAGWNERSADAAARQPVNGVTSLHYPHALDYAMYSYLQLSDQDRAAQTLQRIEAIEEVQPVFASAYGIAAPRARYYLEQERWREAASLTPRVPDALPWEEFPAADVLIYYARGLGAARLGNVEQANDELRRIINAAMMLQDLGDDYWASQAEVLQKTVDAWVLHSEGQAEAALARMQEAAELEDSMEKHPITPGPIRPARELYGEMLLLEDEPAAALAAFNRTLELQPSRRNALSGFERATQRMQERAP